MNAIIFGTILTLLSTRHFVPDPECFGPVQPRLYSKIDISGAPALGAYMITSPASVTYSDCWANATATEITGTQTILSSNGPSSYGNIQAATSFHTYTGSWSGWLNTSAVPQWCYIAAIDSFQFDVGNDHLESPWQCAPAQTCSLTLSVAGSGTVNGPNVGYNQNDCSPVDLTAVPVAGSVFQGWTGAVTSTDSSIHLFMSGDKYITATFGVSPSGGGTGGGGPIGPGDDGGGPGTQLECIPGVDPHCGITSPIVINLDNGTYELTGAKSPVLFDITGTGTKLPIGWTAPGTNQAFLWMDRDHDGVVSGGAELFGTATVLENGHRAANGFEALREFDTNGDGVIDANDPVWPQLLLWTDRNHDGISQPNEITRIADSPVRSISLAYHWTGRRDAHGNTFRYEGLISLSTGGKGLREEPVYDIFFVLAIGGTAIP
jgi:hypothetical protein